MSTFTNNPTTHEPRHGSSTGAAGIPGGQDTRSQYDPTRTRQNPATGSGYSPTGAENTGAPGYVASGAPAGGQTASSSTAEGVGQSIRAAAAGIHGAGESLRGALNAAADKAAGHSESAQRNEAIANKGEREMQSGDFAK